MAKRATSTLMKGAEQRKELAQDANLEVYQLALIMRDMLAGITTTWDGSHAARGMCTRLAELSEIVYAAYLSDDEVELATLQGRLGV